MSYKWTLSMSKPTITMAHIKTSPQEFIREAFPPMIAVMHTPGVDDVCKKNNLNFIQLIKPFSKTTVESKYLFWVWLSVTFQSIVVVFLYFSCNLLYSRIWMIISKFDFHRIQTKGLFTCS